MNNIAPNASEPLEDLLLRARNGSPHELGQLLQHFRLYLLQIAADELESNIRVKAAPSDVVQESLLEASRAFTKFNGKSRESFLAWLRAILRNNLHDLRDRFGTDKRQIQREHDALSLDAALHIPGDLTSPSDAAMRNEQARILEAALAMLAPEARLVIDLRHRQAKSFEDIAAQFNISEDAARQRWTRAVAELRRLTQGTSDSING